VSLTESATLRRKLLIVEDDVAQRAAIVNLLGRRFDVAAVGDGARALEHADVVQPDLVIVDLGLPDIDGLELCRHLLVRGRKVLVVTADDVEDRIITALNMGAADYVVKPYSGGVLEARVMRALRSGDDRLSKSERLVCGDVAIDVADHMVYLDGEPVVVHRKQFTLLVHLARNVGSLVTFASIAQALWGVADDEATVQAVRVAVSRLRADLGTGTHRPVIELAPRVGYRLVLPS